MTYSARTRDRFRTGVTLVSGLATATTLGLTGWLAGVAAHDHQAEQAADDRAERLARQQHRAEMRAWRAAHDRAAGRGAADATRPRVELRQRPQRTHVTVRYVQGAPVGAAPATGGTVSAPAPAAPAAPAPAAPAPAQPAPAAPPPPPPPPPPAPSSGS